MIYGLRFVIGDLPPRGLQSHETVMMAVQIAIGRQQ